MSNKLTALIIVLMLTVLCMNIVLINKLDDKNSVTYFSDLCEEDVSSYDKE